MVTQVPLIAKIVPRACRKVFAMERMRASTRVMWRALVALLTAFVLCFAATAHAIAVEPAAVVQQVETSDDHSHDQKSDGHVGAHAEHSHELVGQVAAGDFHPSLHVAYREVVRHPFTPSVPDLPDRPPEA